MVRDLIDSDFNSSERIIHLKLEIYFNGLSNTPLEITKANYLLYADWLEEGSKESSNSLAGEASANELSFKLYNEDGIFCNTNPTGPYYNLIKKGVPIKLYIKVDSAIDTINWKQLGTYYVSDWIASITSTYAEVTALDKWAQALNGPAPFIEIYAGWPAYINKPVNTFLTDSLGTMGFTDVTISSALSRVIPYPFTMPTAKALFNELAVSDLAVYFTNKTGDLMVDTLLAPKTTRATLLDSEQIVDANTLQSINTLYDGIDLSYVMPQTKTEVEVLKANNITIPANTFMYRVPRLTFSNGPFISAGTIDYTGGVEYGVSVASSWQFDIYFNNTTASPIVITLTVLAYIYDLVQATTIDAVANLYKVNSAYIQTPTQAANFKTIINRYITNKTPMLEIDTRGNPLLSVMDRVTAQSTKYALNYDGIIHRLKYHYEGKLSCTMTLLNYAMLGGAT